jgi:hypothetical protein
MAMLYIAKPFVFPTIHGALYVIKHNDADRATLAPKCDTK